MTKDNKISETSKRRWSVLSHLGIRIGLMLLVFFQVNYLGCQRHSTLDRSRNRQFTLSDQTTRYLDQLGSNVRFVSAFLGSSDILPDVENILSEYDRLGGDRITYENLGLIRSRNRISELRDQLNIDISRDQVVIISDSGRVKVLGSEELVARDASTRRIIEFRGEEKFTAALLEVTEKKQRKVYLDTGNRRIDQLGVIAQKLDILAKSQNAKLQSISLKGLTTIPKDADALVFAGITTDLTRPEADMVKEWWEQNKTGLLVLLDPAAQTPNLHSILGANGLRPRLDRVLSVPAIPGLKQQIIYDVRSTLLPGSGPTRDLPVMSLQLRRRTQSLELQASDERFVSQNIKPTPLVVAASEFWSETDFGAANVVFNPDFDTGFPEPVIVAAAVEHGDPDDQLFENGAARMVVIGNPNLLSPDSNYDKTASDFFMSSLNWVMSRDQLLGISPRRPTVYDLSIRPSTFGLLQSLVVWVFPATLLFAGCFVWYQRRA